MLLGEAPAGNTTPSLQRFAFLNEEDETKSPKVKPSAGKRLFGVDDEDDAEVVSTWTFAEEEKDL